jgi:transketolase
VLYSATEKFPIGGSKTLRQGASDVCVVVAAGITLHESLKAYDLLRAEGIAITVVDAYSVKPIDAEGLHKAAAAAGQRILVVEDHWREGGLGDAVLEVFSESGNVRIRKIAVTELPHSGKPEELLDLYGLSARRIVEAVRAFVK